MGTRIFQNADVALKIMLLANVILTSIFCFIFFARYTSVLREDRVVLSTIYRRDLLHATYTRIFMRGPVIGVCRQS